MNIEIMAEVAQGFEGNFVQSKLLIKAAAKSNADIVKFQMVYADELATNDYKYYELFKKIELTEEQWFELNKFANESKIKFVLDVFGEKSLNIASQILAYGVKIHPTDIANESLLNLINKSNVENVYIGVGGALFSEINKALQLLQNKKVTVIFGFQTYPTPNNSNQLSRISVFNELIKNNFNNVIVGFADHSVVDGDLKNCISVVAIGCGAKVIEKHLTLGKIMELEDFESALNPDEFKEFVKICHASHEAIGNSNNEDDFGMSEFEYTYRKNISRHVVAAKNIKSGQIIYPTDVILKRTSSENPILNISHVYNKKSYKDIAMNNPLEANDLER